jgi:tartrate dehydrogenase/decarboxylase/D-malate dehydrogenase
MALSEAMLLDYLGESAASNALWDAVSTQLTDETAPRTPDLGGTASTTVVVDDLRARLDG